MTLYILILILVTVAVFFIWKQTHTSDTKIDSGTNTQIEKWLGYENAAYRYKLSYPDTALISNTQEMNVNTVEESNDIQIFIPGSTTSVSIFAFTKDQPLYSILAPDQTGVTPKSSLKDITEKVHQNQIDDKNPYIKDKKIGDIKEVTFAGEKAYSFTLLGGFATNLTGMGYVLPGTHNYIFVEKNNTKFVIHYPIGDKVSEKIIESFEFNK